MSIFDDMLVEFKDLASLKEFSREQHNEIVKLTNQIDRLKVENKKLKEGISTSSLPALTTASNIKIIETLDDEYQEIICRGEIKKLHDDSMGRALTYEEAKKLEIYTKLLLQIQKKNAPGEREVTKINETDLLKLVEND